MELHLGDDLGKTSLEFDEANAPRAIIILAHGAGAGMNHPFMVSLAQRFSKEGIHALRFNFPYMEQGRKSPGSPKKNISTWKVIVEYVSNQYPTLPVFVSGKSYGGRMASHLLAEENLSQVQGVIYFGFPLHAPGRDSKERANHLDAVRVPQLFLQGMNDKLANIQLMREVVNSLDNADLLEIEDGDHSFNVPKRSTTTKEEVLDQMIKKVVSFIKTTKPNAT